MTAAGIEGRGEEGMTAAGGSRRPTAIVSPLAAELAAVAAAATGLRRFRLNGAWAARGWLRERPVLLATTGDGGRSAARGLAALLAAARPERLLFLGVAGGISPGLAIGDLVVPRRLFSWLGGAASPADGPAAEIAAGRDAGEWQEAAAPDAGWFAQAVAGGSRLAGGASRDAGELSAEEGAGSQKAGEPRRVDATERAERSGDGMDPGARSRVPVAAGAAITCDRILVEAREKAALYQRFRRRAPGQAAGQPVVCDVESAVYARLAAANGVPFLVVRAVIDLADEDLPIDFNLCRTSGGEVSNARVVTRVLAGAFDLASPRRRGFAELLRLRARLRLCSRRLAAITMDLVGDAVPPLALTHAVGVAGRAGG